MKAIRYQHDSLHLLTSLDARVKLLAALTLLIMVISSRGAGFPLLVAGLSLALCLAMRVRLWLLLIRFAEPLFIAIMVLLLKLFFSGHEQLFNLPLFGLEIVGYRDGLFEGIRIACRIIGAVSIVATVGFATPFTELMSALAWLRVPQGFIDVSLFACRYLFLLFDDAMVVYQAQRNRLGYVGYCRGLRSFGTLAGALVIKSFDQSQSVTTAMVQRGYDGSLPLLKHKPLKWRETVPALFILAVMGILWQI